MLNLIDTKVGIHTIQEKSLNDTTNLVVVEVNRTTNKSSCVEAMIFISGSFANDKHKISCRAGKFTLKV